MFKSASFWTAASTVAIAFFTAVLVGASYSQWSEMRQSRLDTEAVIRANMTFDKFEYRVVPNVGWEFKPRYKNIGTTDAINNVMKWKLQYSPPDEATCPDLQKAASIEESHIRPTVPYVMQDGKTVPITVTEDIILHKKSIRIFAAGSIQYGDIFGSVQAPLAWCYELAPADPSITDGSGWTYIFSIR